MTEFKEGQKVRRIKGVPHVGMKVGDVGTVESVIASGANLIIKEFQQPGWSHAAENFEPVPVGSERQELKKWSDVEVGDKVTFRVDDTEEEHTATAYRARGCVRVLGFQVDGPPVGFLALLSIEKPKPQLPTTPGSHVTVPFPGWESGINHLFLLDSGKWASQTGLAFWAAEDVASKDFTVIHDAGAK